MFFANNQEFQHGEKEEQEIITACKVLIQNAIVLWNYLYLSQIMATNANKHERVILKLQGCVIKLNDNGLVALALLIAESNPTQKDLMVRLVVNILMD